MRYHRPVEEAAMKRNVVVVLGLAGVVALGFAGTVSAQAQPGGQSASVLSEILSELRALRAEVNQAAGSGLRAQLLVARLALQEQRITVSARQLAEIHEKLQANERNRPLATMLKSIGAKPDTVPPGEPEEPNPLLDAIRKQADELDKSDEELKAQYAELSRVLAEEQSRWTTFNAQLEALEKSLRVK
jgi:hypothetical protein